MRRLSLVVALAVVSVWATPAGAQDTRQASQHFQRGVTLYGEADYRAALVEFERAYAIAPNPSVLYNVGETHYQLLDYAAALTAFERFLAEAPAGDMRRSEVESNLDVLRTRVGRVSVTTDPAGADIAIDDEPRGRTPLERPVLVSVGRRKVVASLAGRPAVTRYVDVAAEDNVSLAVALPEPPQPLASTPAEAVSRHAPLATVAPTGGGGGAALRTIGWVATATLAAGAGCFGLLALRESRDLVTDRNTFPVPSDRLQHEASLTTTYSMLADGLAAGAVAVGAVTLVATALSGTSARPLRGTGAGTQVVLGPGSASLLVTF
jgi:hypothetical protein